MSVSFNVIWIKELYMSIAPSVSGEYKVAHSQSLVEGGMVSLDTLPGCYRFC